MIQKTCRRNPTNLFRILWSETYSRAKEKNTKSYQGLQFEDTLPTYSRPTATQDSLPEYTRRPSTRKSTRITPEITTAASPGDDIVFPASTLGTVGLTLPSFTKNTGVSTLKGPNRGQKFVHISVVLLSSIL